MAELLYFGSPNPRLMIMAVDNRFVLPAHEDLARLGRVDDWRGGQERLRLQSPLIEPYVRISRIRLSDKTSCLRPRKAVLKRLHADQPQGLVQVLIGEACDPLTALLVLLAQPPA